MNLTELETKLLSELGLQIENNDSITYIKNGEKTLATCNKKPVLARYCDTTVVSSYNFIVFNFHSQSMNCSYYLLKHQISSMISSKINAVMSSLFQYANNTSLHHQECGELNQLILDLQNHWKDGIDAKTIEKWSALFKIIQEQPIQDMLIKLNQRFEPIVIDDQNIIDSYDKRFNIQQAEATYITTYPFIELSFPLYELLKDLDSTKLLGVNIEQKDIDVFQMLYRYIFEGIDTPENYRFLTKKLWNKKTQDANERIYIVEEIPTAYPLMLVRVFIKVANRLDHVLGQLSPMNKLDIESKMFNLTITEEMINDLEDSVYHPSFDFENKNDALFEAKLPINLESLNKSLNAKSTVESSPPIQKSAPTIQRLRTWNKPISTTFSSTFPLLLNTDRYIEKLSVNNFDTVFPPHARNHHTYILGGSGSGKSELMKIDIHENVAKNDSSNVLIDLHGDLAKQVARSIEDKERLTYLDLYLAKNKIFTINPLQIECKDEEIIAILTQELISVFEIALDLDWSLNMEALLVPCISTLLRKRDSDLYELQRFMNDDKNSYLIALGKKSPIKGHRDFFTDQFENEKFKTTKNAISTKLQILLNDPVFANLVTGKSTINLEQEINTPGKIIIFRLPKGVMKTTGSIYGRFIMALIQTIALKREKIPEHLRPHTHLYLDEFQNFIGSTIEEILTESRKYKLYVTFAHQSLASLGSKLKDIVFSNTLTKIVSHSSHKALKAMKAEIQVDTKEMKNLSTGEFYAKVGSKQAFKIKTSSELAGDNAAIDEKKWQDHVKHQLDNYYRAIEEYIASDNESTSDQVSKSDTANSSTALFPKYADF